jgi:predicted HTH transcriptional regulator
MAEPSRADIQRQLVELLDYPREDVDTEIKDWLPLESKPAQADLVRELIALANHGGGYLLFGFRDQDDGWPPSGPCPYPLKHYSQDAINNAIKTYAEPPFECPVDHLESSTGDVHVVVGVPGGYRVPIRSKRAGPDGSRLAVDTYYIRRPGAESAPPQSGREWDELLRRCLSAHREELLESFRNIIGIVGAGSDIAQALSAGESAEARLETWEQASLARLVERQGDGGNS